MNIYASTILGIIGLYIGYIVPSLSLKIIEYKKGTKNKDSEDKSLLAKWIRIFICLFNGAVWWFTAFNANSLLMALLICMQITLGIIFAYIDIKIRIIPNELVLIMIVLGIIFQILHYGISSLITAFISMIVMMVVFTAVAGFVGFGKVGAGDVKLAGAMGLALGYPLIITAVGIMAVALLVFILGGLALKKIYLSTMLPFAPFMIIGFIVALITILI